MAQLTVTGNAVVAQSGGPTAVINNSVCGVVQEWLKSGGGSLYGSLFGIRGILEDNLLDLGRQRKETIAALRHTPGAALGSSRYRLKSGSDYNRLLQAFRKYNIRHFFYIGGNDSMDTANKINLLAVKEGYEVKVVGIPKTIDNDLPHTDHCPGYGSAAKYLAASVMAAGLDLKSLITKNRVVIVEAMGRNTGWLAAAAALAKRSDDDAPHLIYLPEVPFIRSRFIEDVQEAYRAYGFACIVVSEGLRCEKGDYIFAGGCADAFGHIRLGGLGDTLKTLLEEQIDIKVRANVLGTIQRAAMHYASQTDADEAYMVGAEAVKAARRGESGLMITLDREDDAGGYRCRAGRAPLDRVANVEKRVPLEWINRERNYISGAFLDYVRPLIKGEVSVPTRNGLPDYVSLDGFNASELRRRLERETAGIAP